MFEFDSRTEAVEGSHSFTDLQKEQQVLVFREVLGSVALKDQGSLKYHLYAATVG